MTTASTPLTVLVADDHHVTLLAGHRPGQGGQRVEQQLGRIGDQHVVVFIVVERQVPEHAAGASVVTAIVSRLDQAGQLCPAGGGHGAAAVDGDGLGREPLEQARDARPDALTAGDRDHLLVLL